MKVLYVITAVLFAVTISPDLGYSAGFNAEMTKYLQELEAQSKKQESGFKGFDAERGKKLFFEVKTNEKIGSISCATCHTPNLKNSGKTLVGKVIEPLAPSVNKNRLTDVKETKKWLARNFKQVYGREGTPREKGDVLTFISKQ
jgi:cytochrome c peroxidase